MELNGFLESIYRFMQGLYSESGIRSAINGVKGWFEGRTAGDALRNMLLTAAVIIIVGFLIDMVLYWTREDQKVKLRSFARFVTGVFKRRPS